MPDRSLTIPLRGDTADIAAKMKETTATFDRLRERFDRTKLNLKLDDKETLVKFKELGLQMDKLGRRVARPAVSLEGADRASLAIDKLDLKLDKLSEKTARVADAGRGGIFGKIGSLFSGGGGGAGGAAGAASGGGSLLTNPYVIGGGVALSPIIAGLINSLGVFGLGSGAGALAGLGAYKFDKQQLTPGISSITGALKAPFESVGPSIGMMLASLGKFTKAEAGPLSALFGSSLPFLNAWMKVAKEAARSIIPALTSTMNSMARSGALKEMTQGFIFLTQGIASFVRLSGSGIKASAEIFRGSALVIRDILIALGETFSGLSGAAGHAFSGIRDAWDGIRHATANTFDSIRHDLAANNDAWISRMDDLRHSTASIWDAIFSNTIGTVIRLNSEMGKDFRSGVLAVVGFFSRLPGQVGRVLSSFGGMLESVGHNAIDSMLKGMESVAGSLLSWVSNFVKNIWHDVKSFFGFGSPSKLFYNAGKNIVLGMAHGIKDHAHHAMAAARAMSASVGGHVSGTAAQAQAYGRRLASAYGWAGQWSDINAVAMRESGWNPTARNPSSGAYGIAQFINGPSEYYSYGGSPNSVTGQVRAFYNYIRQRYGSPAGAWAHELNFGFYDRGGKLPPGLSLALNTTGHDEIHTAGGSGSGDVNINVYCHPTNNPDETARQVITMLRKYKLRHHSPSLGIG